MQNPSNSSPAFPLACDFRDMVHDTDVFPDKAASSDESTDSEQEEHHEEARDVFAESPVPVEVLSDYPDPPKLSLATDDGRDLTGAVASFSFGEASTTESNRLQGLGAPADFSLEIQPSRKPSMTTGGTPELPGKCEQGSEMNLVDRLRAKLNIGNELYRAALCELFCTGFLLFAGGAVNAQYIISQRKNNEWIGVSVGWGLVLMFAVLMGHRISGAHLNPAVSFFQLTQGKINALRFVVFVIAQNIGAFFGALTTFVVYYDAINYFDNGTRYVSGPRATAQIFATYPAPYLSTLGGVIDQIAGTACLCMGIAAITDRRNRVPPFLQPAFIGSLLAVLGMFVAMNAGYAINPARDFGPRLFTLCAGYGWRVFSYRSYKWFWIPIVCPMIGAVIGAWLYEFFIGFHIPDDPETTYIHKILDDRNPDGQLREVHLIETKPLSERPPEQTSPTQYRNM